MLSRRNLVLRLSIFFNVVVLLYVATHMVGGRGEEQASQSAMESSNSLTSSGRNLASIDSAAEPDDAGFTPPAAPQVVAADSVKCINVTIATTEVRSNAPSSSSFSTTITTPSVLPTAPSLAELLGCSDRRPTPRYQQRGDHWVLMDYVRPAKRFSCAESVTYTTHGDFTFLDNLPPLLERWRGPVSLALFAPGEDFAFTLSAISYARSCLSPLVRELVTFHLYFGVKDIPSKVPRPEGENFPPEYDCAGRPPPPPWGNGTAAYTSYKSRKNLLYPVNVGRNIARESTTTHYVLPSDIELYPSPGLIGDFLDFMKREKEAEFAIINSSQSSTPDNTNRTPSSLRVKTTVNRVYVLPIFEIASNMSQPVTKIELVRMLKNGSAIPFHKKLCAGCHAVPKAKEWESASIDGDEKKPLGVFHVGKRVGSYYHWEPIFIGTNDEPPYDERLSWEGKSDKMTQGYALCALDYEFRILDQAFLVHRPGIKSYKKDPKRSALAAKTNTLIKKVIGPELKVLYGTRKGCVV